MQHAPSSFSNTTDHVSDTFASREGVHYCPISGSWRARLRISGQLYSKNFHVATLGRELAYKQAVEYRELLVKTYRKEVQDPSGCKGVAFKKDRWCVGFKTGGVHKYVSFAVATHGKENSRLIALQVHAEQQKQQAETNGSLMNADEIYHILQQLRNNTLRKSSGWILKYRQMSGVRGCVKVRRRRRIGGRNVCVFPSIRMGSSKRNHR
eukprot:GDKI01026086.1.p1 GENE.GDKI01026086.1~~GDKI01026086.1.p1  ORF type:complete len:209 (+),score=13.04 GDKI01026086.1:43-669(+)